ncbi:16S rRNA (cytosine(1402)-N(4))-methyltransferase RsmH [Mycolicibacterium sp. NCC-Tsukiji]|uniref:16S rRNA (cytosine(1402)-N(4))-methyltransferase RsmH n=1 Tax=Mycolicibacterium sp. NCC-Tsukiji TaxID=2185272 RepID=UPI000EE24D6D|nr:16S rRNA (cytosine(1402)-N(4))-methyltransferase RsmH [Mycolicibacterium sp. NCC-Tsukiji]GCA97828.1 ribosomal RNA small subunit methyltransferase H [Mycolicibacterium sp. NCC-Tsukiji]
MKRSAAPFDLQARAAWPLPEPALAYFPNVRFANSDRDLAAGAAQIHQLKPFGGVALTDRRPHIPVLLDRCVELLAPALTRNSSDGAGAVMIDATLGAGGHSEAFLTRFPAVTLIGLDRDQTALRLAGERLAPFGDRVHLVHTPYDGIDEALTQSGYRPGELDAILFDLGVSSMQLDQAERGFAYAQDAPLDMRMDQSSGLTAADILNTYDAKALTRVLREYGEEKFAPKIARAIVSERARRPFTTTTELVELLYAVIPAPARRTGGHPAKRTFQALRTEVNGELDCLRAAIPAALDALRPGGRIAVEAYQSLEDRIVKGYFTDAIASRTPEGLPMELPGYEPLFTSLTRGAERADEHELELNPRSASVRLRALEKVVTRGGL